MLACVSLCCLCFRATTARLAAPALPASKVQCADPAPGASSSHSGWSASLSQACAIPVRRRRRACACATRTSAAICASTAMPPRATRTAPSTRQGEFTVRPAVSVCSCAHVRSASSCFAECARARKASPARTATRAPRYAAQRLRVVFCALLTGCVCSFLSLARQDYYAYPTCKYCLASTTWWVFSPACCDSFGNCPHLTYASS